jgi:hypothetical protein
MDRIFLSERQAGWMLRRPDRPAQAFRIVLDGAQQRSRRTARALGPSLPFLDRSQAEFASGRELGLRHAGGATDRAHVDFRRHVRFEASGFDIKYAPVHAAFVAYVRGERFLRDVNPEVRRPAQDFYDKLSAPRRHAGGGEPAGKSKRGPKRKA